MKAFKNIKWFSLVYFAIVIVIFSFHLTAYSSSEYFTKPVALIMLLFYFRAFNDDLPKGLKQGIQYGLVLSILTDLSFVLQFSVHPLFVLAGFIFSISTIYFYTKSLQHTNDTFISMWNMSAVTPTHLFLSILMISFPIIIFLIEGASIWQYPAILYQIFLWFLITQALKRQDLVNETSYYMVLSGVFLFAITTVMLTLKTLTHETLSFGNFPVLSYFTSQYLIVMGALKQSEK